MSDEALEIIGVGAIIVVIVATITAVVMIDQKSVEPVKPSDAHRQEQSSSSGPRIGVTATGKPGIELAPGLVMGMDGKVGPGMGF